ncbi:MAG: hypothetical protein A2946_03630 [Candidatus Liptonbacteria bacterium RIFCSPLOWO2_01_FULL_53_13]|uniref:Uncharacterized protein n=1 Tax=Candidatus Liptonbacteria bacterium RIFCSPLOWO2_01_FULL_53_13 TaxID=1798651 RepID=A0A1G2CL96_9BACT|nr:MAG: hypothetical protein A2946_03630 [Candidatus Liptonbacteria bacterium RIFCSPLOWO2_01_FULL_53_13]
MLWRVISGAPAANDFCVISSAGAKFPNTTNEANTIAPVTTANPKKCFFVFIFLIFYRDFPFDKGFPQLLIMHRFYSCPQGYANARFAQGLWGGKRE